MGTVTLQIGEHRWPVACRDGEEPRLEMLGGMIAARWPDAQRAAGKGGIQQALLLAALMLADDLADAPAAAAAPGNETLARIAAQLEAIADGLENTGASD